MDSRDLTAWKRLRKRDSHDSRIVFGDPTKNDPRRLKSVSSACSSTHIGSVAGLLMKTTSAVGCFLEVLMNSDMLPWRVVAITQQHLAFSLEAIDGPVFLLGLPDVQLSYVCAC